MIFRSPYIKLSKFGLETYSRIYSYPSDNSSGLTLKEKLLLADILDFRDYCYRDENKKWYHKLIEKIFRVDIISRVS